LVVVVGGISKADAQSRKEVYELQERCGRRAEQIFEKDFPANDRKGLETFENHYNVRLNKCFILEDNTVFTADAGKSYKSKLLTLIDVNDNKIFASFSPLNCDIGSTKCRSEEEFRALIRPLMEE
jgi:hypothetical protein